MNNNQEHNHLISKIENTQKNREFVTELNEKMKKSNSMHRLRIKYRSPKEGTYGYYGGSCPKDNAQCFSLYLKKTPQQESLENEQRSKRWERESEYRRKYERLQQKYNTEMLKPLLQGLKDNIEELQYAVDKGHHWSSIVDSLNGVVKGVTEDITNDLEV